MDNAEKLVAEIGRKFLPLVKVKGNVYRIDAADLYYRDLNILLRALSNNGAEKIEIRNVYGQRYIGTDLDKKMDIIIYGTPGNDLGAFMNGPTVVVHGNAQDGCGNTMNDGLIVIHGHAGDITGYSMRGGKLFIRDDVGYRVGIHMKEYQDKRPCLVIGGTAADFLGEYMAGGVMLILGLNLGKGKKHQARFVGTGMHGGVIYVRGEVKHLGKEAEASDVNEGDMHLINDLTGEFCKHFNFNLKNIMKDGFTKITPISRRPFGNLYTY
jgi:glutamate synthase domain-containing protein 3